MTIDELEAAGREAVLDCCTDCSAKGTGCEGCGNNVEAEA
jgi:hypothetical protein